MTPFESLVKTVEALLGENGCPWDKQQTFKTLKKYIAEECNEVIEAVNNGDSDNLREELGDVMLVVLLFAKIAEKDGLFDLDGVLNGINEKLIRRHTHVFGNVKACTPEEALKNWNAEKRREKEDIIK